MRELHLRDLHTELGEQIDATEDMESFLKIRLEMATMREENAREVVEYAEENHKKAVKVLEGATSKRVYWEDQLQKVRERNQPTTATESPITATESRTYVIHTNGVSMEEIDHLIQEKASKVFRHLEEDEEL